MSHRTIADLYPVLKAQFDADPKATSIEVYRDGGQGAPIMTVTREVFERERLARDVSILNRPIRNVH